MAHTNRLLYYAGGTYADICVYGAEKYGESLAELLIRVFLFSWAPVKIHASKNQLQPPVVGRSG